MVAIGSDGIFVPMPAQIPVANGCLIEGHSSALELVVAEDVEIVIKFWESTLKTKTGHCEVHLSKDPTHPVTLHFVDATDKYGVFLGFITGYREIEAGTEAVEPGVRPRFCAIQKNGIAVITKIDTAFTRMLGWTSDEIVGQRSLHFIHPDDQMRAITNFVDCLSARGEGRRVRLRHRHRNGSWVWFELTNTNLLNDPEHAYIATEMIDVSDELAAQEALRASEQLLRRLTEALPLGIVQIDATRKILYHNERLTQIIGCSAPTIDDLLSSVAEGDREALDTALLAVLGDGLDVDVELSFRPDDGARRCSLNMRPLTSENGEVSGAIISIADVTERVRLRQELEIRATYDALTGCHNRSSILERLEHLLLSPRAAGTGTAVLFIDLDDFKAVNDTFGHAAGDELLRRTGECLLAAGRAGDAIGRLGGDEFLVVCQEVATPERALEIAQRIAGALAEVVPGPDRVHPAASVGVAWSNTIEDADMLVAVADSAMYQSKREGMGRPVLVGPSQRRPSNARAEVKAARRSEPTKA